MPALFAPRARREFLRVLAELDAESPGAARAFRIAVEAAARKLGEHPRAAPHRPDLAPEPWRFASVAGFPWFLVYQPERTPPLVVRVIHQRRDLEAELRDLRAR